MTRKTSILQKKSKVYLSMEKAVVNALLKITLKITFKYRISNIGQKIEFLRIEILNAEVYYVSYE